MTQHQKFGKEKIHTAMDREPGNKTENNTKKNKRRVKKWCTSPEVNVFWKSGISFA